MVQGDGRECTGHLQCPFCGSYVVRRLYVAPLDSDACTCGLCLRAWSEERESGRYRGETADASVLLHRAD